MSVPFHWPVPCVCSRTSSCPAETHSFGNEHTWSGSYSGRCWDNSPQWLLTVHNDHNAAEGRKKTITLIQFKQVHHSFSTCDNCSPSTLRVTNTHLATGNIINLLIHILIISYQVAPSWDSTVHLQKSTILFIHLCRPEAAINMSPLILSQIQQPSCILQGEKALISLS